MSPTKFAKVYRVKIEPPIEPFLSAEDSATRVENALSQGSGAERYGRLWRIGRVEKQGRVLVGKLGIVNRAKRTESWNEKEEDFEELEFTEGASAIFAVNLESLTLAVQPTADVKITGALGALRAMLSLEGEKWTISPLKKSVDFSDWIKTVDRVVRVKYRLRKPNPHYGDAKNLEDIMEAAEAQVVSLEMASDDGLDLNSSFLQETQLHTDRGYGEADFTGIKNAEDGDIIESKFSSLAGAEEEAVEVPVLENGEISTESIARLSQRGD